MNTSNQARSVSTSFVGHVAPMVSTEVRQMAALGHQQGWDFAVLGQALLPSEAVRLEDWLIVPVQQDSGPMPARALERVQVIFEAGLRPKGFVVVHEAPKLLPAPQESQPNTLRMSALPGQIRSALKIGSTVLGALGALLVATTGLIVAAAVAFGLAAALVLPAIVVYGAVMIDPILVAVTEDGYWVEIDRWWS